MKNFIFCAARHFSVFTLILTASLICSAGAEGGPKKFVGLIKPGESASHTVTFKGGEEASIEAWCYGLCSVTIYREDGSVSGSADTKPTDDYGYEVILDFTPEKKTTYTIVVRNKETSCSGDDCRYDLRTN